MEDHLKKARQTETIKRAGVEQTKKNLIELIEIQQNQGDLQNSKNDYDEYQRRS